MAPREQVERLLGLGWSRSMLCKLLDIGDSYLIVIERGGTVEKSVTDRLDKLYRDAFKRRTVKRPWWTKEQREALARLEERGVPAKDVINAGLYMLGE